MTYELPTQGANEGTWGTDLNNALRQEHDKYAKHNSDVFIDTLDTKLLFNMNGEIMTNMSGELVYLKE